MSSSVELSPAARARQQAMLPELLTAVKHRRRRRHVVRATVALLFVGVVAFAAQSLWRSDEPVSPGPGPNDVAAWTTFRDDPATRERYVVATVRKREWFVDDDGLNDLLRESGRRTGIIRAGGRVAVNEAAVDPWPESDDE